MSIYRILEKLQDAHCIRASMMVNRADKRKYCLVCFTLRVFDPNDYAMVLEHYAVKGTYECRCTDCNKDLTIVKSLHDCDRCKQRCTRLWSSLIAEGIDVTHENFRYNHDNATVKFS